MKCDICAGELKKIYQKIKKEESALFYELKEYSGDGKDIFYNAEKNLDKCTPIFEKYINSGFDHYHTEPSIHSDPANDSNLIITLCDECRFFGAEKYFKKSVKKKSFLWIYLTTVLTIEKNYIIDNKAKWKKSILDHWEKIINSTRKRIIREEKRIDSLKSNISKFLKKSGKKHTASDIAAHLKHKNTDEIKKLCKILHLDDTIFRTGNYRYYINSKKSK